MLARGIQSLLSLKGSARPSEQLQPCRQGPVGTWPMYCPEFLIWSARRALAKIVVCCQRKLSAM
eukprot:15435374-Alexandrium_andersonii.AAC.1